MKATSLLLTGLTICLLVTGTTWAADVHIEATFEAAPVGPWTPGDGVELGTVTHPLGAAIDVVSPGFEGTSRALLLQDVGVQSAVVELTAPTPDPGTATDPYWLELTVTLDPALSVANDAVAFVRVWDGGGTPIVWSWLGISAASPEFRYRICQDPGCLPPAQTVVLSTLDASDEWSIRIEIDPSAGTQKHWIWKNGVRIVHDLLVTATGEARSYGLVTPSSGSFEKFRLSTIGNNADADAVVGLDEVRVTSLAPAENLTALPYTDGTIRLTWDAVAGADGYTVQRRRISEPGTEWADIATGLPAPTHDDNVGALREKFQYRVAAEHAGTRSTWSDSDSAVPVYTGKPWFGWLNLSDYLAGIGCSDPLDAACTTQAFQSALDDLGPYENGNPNFFKGPRVLWIPDRVEPYLIDSTLYIEGKTGLQLIGESAGGVTIRWAGGPGTSPEDVRVLFHAEGSKYITYRNLIWDGGCAGTGPLPQQDGCFVVAFDMSFCGVCATPACDQGEDRDSQCDSLMWDEDPLIGLANVGSGHFDSQFINAYVGLRLSHHGVQDSDITIRRNQFHDNFAGVSVEDFNALTIGLWDNLFDTNGFGITNNIAFSRREVDPNYKPGECELAGVGTGQPCLSQFVDCGPGETCNYDRRWAGDFQSMRSRFVNTHYAVWAEPTGHFDVRDSWAQGGDEFFRSPGASSTPGSYTLQGNYVEDASGVVVRTKTPGTFLFSDNEILSEASPAIAPVEMNTLGIGGSNPSDSIGLIATGNAYDYVPDPADCPTGTLFGAYCVLSTPDVRAADSGVPATVSMPPLPTPTDPLSNRRVFTVTEDEQAQAVIDAALAYRGASSNEVVVHFPAREDKVEYVVSDTLTIPAGAGIVIAGDGPWTRLAWEGTAGEPMLDIDAANAAGVIIRDLQPTGGIHFRNVDQGPGGVQIARVVYAINDVGLAVVGTEAVPVEMVHSWTAGNISTTNKATSIGLQLKSSGSTVPVNEGVTVWSSTATGNEADFDVINDTAGARLLVNYNYMEDSLHYLRARGTGSQSRIALHGGKIASIVPGSCSSDPTHPCQNDAQCPVGDTCLDPDLSTEAAPLLIENYSGNVSLIESRMFIQPELSNPPVSTQVAHDHGARIRVIGADPVDIQFIGGTVQRLTAENQPDNPEYDFDPGSDVDYLRLGLKVGTPPAVPRDDIRITASGAPIVLPPTDTGWIAEVATGLDLLRTSTPPAYYDESSAYKIAVDNIFFDRAAKYAITLSGGQSCAADAECDDGLYCTTDRCDKDGLSAGVPGICAYDPVACPANEFCHEELQGDCQPTCPASYGCQGTGCHLVFPRVCNEQDTGDNSCWDDGLFECVLAAQTIRVKNCDCEADEPGNICINQNQSFYCRQDCSSDPECDDGTFCNGVEVCNAAVGCQLGPDPCDDGLFCNGVETCTEAGGCQAGTPPCAAGLTCDEVDDACYEDCPPEHDCGPGGCKVKKPLTCTSYSTGNATCYQGDVGGVPTFLRCDPGQTVFVRNCECKAPQGQPCFNEDQSLLCQ